MAAITGTDNTILAHHRDAARTWGAGGRAYDNVSFAISDALAHAAQRLNPKPGQRILDVATGTGWSARNAARAGANVTAIDIAPELLAAGRELSAHLPIEFQQADAERLPFPDACFDGVISTFGVMFAIDQAQAARELSRVCRPGGRLVVAAWAPDGAVAEFFGALAKHSDAVPPALSPMAWGDSKHVNALLGDSFALKFEPGVSHAYHDDEDDIWSWYSRGFGPIRMLLDTLPPERRAALKRDVDAYHSHYRAPAGLAIAREYLLTIGVRR
jgi:ubiquinone/menaquinone biosynthesis C-methylase UbiE